MHFPVNFGTLLPHIYFISRSSESCSFNREARVFLLLHRANKLS